MTIGTGIALASIWLMPSAAMLSKTVTAAGVWCAWIIAFLASAAILYVAVPV